MVSPVLEIDDLNITLKSRRGPLRAVRGVSLAIMPGEIVGLVGESASGKSTLCFSIVRMLPPSAQVSGRILFKGEDLIAKSDKEMRALRGREITMVQQNPMTALDPVFTVGNQMREVLAHNSGLSARERASRTIELLRQVHIPAPETRVDNYPHQMSGGMKQRVITAMATALNPSLLLADEPTTALDVSIQEQILRLFSEIRDRLNTAMIVVTHDLGVVRRLCDRIFVMYAGTIVESGETEAIFRKPEHPYTRALIESIPLLGADVTALRDIGGQPPDLTHPIPGCAFEPRCDKAFEPCSREFPVQHLVDERHQARCWLHTRPSA